VPVFLVPPCARYITYVAVEHHTFVHERLILVLASADCRVSSDVRHRSQHLSIVGLTCQRPARLRQARKREPAPPRRLGQGRYDNDDRKLATADRSAAGTTTASNDARASGMARVESSTIE
jgi:hypothetical protein